MPLSSQPTHLSSKTRPQPPSHRAGIVACRLRGHLLEEEAEGRGFLRRAEEGQEEGALVGFLEVECRVRREVPGVELRGEWGGRQEVRACGEG